MNAKEFFDTPKDYHNEFTTGAIMREELNNSGFMSRKSSKTPHHNNSISTSSPSKTFGETRRSLNQIERMSYSAIRGFNRTQHNQRFDLIPDKFNRHRVTPIVTSTVHLHNSIPFLRDKRNVSNQTFSRLQNPASTTNKRHFSATQHVRAQTATQRRQRKREVGWDNNIKPISGINERVHSSQRTVFEHL